jgi:hypothetical protein
MNRIWDRVIFFVLLIAALAIIWNVLAPESRQANGLSAITPVYCGSFSLANALRLREH